MATPRDLREQEVEEDKNKIREPYDVIIKDEPHKGNTENVFERLENAPSDNIKKFFDNADPKNQLDIEDPNWVKLKAWKSLPLGPERDAAKTQWYQETYGKDPEEKGGPWSQPDDALDNHSNSAVSYMSRMGYGPTVFKNLSIPGFMTFDWKMDFLGSIPGLGWLDNIYDDFTKMDPARQKIRNIGSSAYMFIRGNKAIDKAITRNAAVNNVPLWQARIQRNLAKLGWNVGVTSIADQSEEMDNIPRMMADMNPELFGADGKLPWVNWLATNESDSTRMRTLKNMFDELTFNQALEVIGEGMSLYKYGGKPNTLRNFLPKDTLAEVYKNKEIWNAGSTAIKNRIIEIDTILEQPKGKYFNKQPLIEEKLKLQAQLAKPDTVTVLENAQKQLDRKREAKALSKLKKETNSVDYDPDINNVLGDSTDSINQPGRVAKNMAENDGLERGILEGDPEPLNLDLNVSTENLRAQEGVPSSGPVRDAVIQLEGESLAVGDFKWKSESFEQARKNMSKSSFDFYSKILEFEDGDALKKYLQSNYNRFYTDVAGNKQGYLDQSLIGQEGPLTQALATIFERYFKPSVTEASANAVRTSAKEIRTLANTFSAFRDLDMPPEQFLDKIFKKAIVLVDEIALSKRIAGRDLQALQKGSKKGLSPQAVDSLLNLKNVEKEIHAKNVEIFNTLSDLVKKNPKIGESMMDVLQLLDDDVNGIANLWKWFRKEISPLGYIYSRGKGGMNSFGKYTWGTGYTWIIGTKSVYNATKGALGTIVASPITSLLGNTIYGFADDFVGLERALFMYGSLHETMSRATHHGYKMMLKNWDDPSFFAKIGRKDYVVEDDAKWKLIEAMGGIAKKEGNVFDTINFTATNWARNAQRANYFRYGMVGLASLDAGLNSFNTTLISRLRAYDDAYKKFGIVNSNMIAAGEASMYKNMWDSDGQPTDELARTLSREMALNTDTIASKQLAKLTTKVPFSKHAFAFPRSLINEKILNASYTPLSAIPGFGKYSKTVFAKTPEQIAEALALHGIKSTDKNATAIFEHLQRHYLGRWALGAGLTKGLQNMALSGMIRGPGHHDYKRRRSEQINGYEPYTIQLVPGGPYISYRGWPIVAPILSTLGGIYYYAEENDEALAEDAMTKIAHLFTAAFLDSSMAANLRPFMDTILGEMSWEKTQISLSKFVNNGSKFFTPWNSELTQLAHSIDDSARTIEKNSLDRMIRSKPFASKTLPIEYNPWTAQVNRYQDNPWLRNLNRFIPDDFGKEEEPYAKVLRFAGYPGMNLIEKSVIADIEFDSHQRAAVLKEMSRLGPLKDHPDFIKLMNSSAAKQHSAELRDYNIMNLNGEYQNLKSNQNLLPLKQRIEALWKSRQQQAEMNLMNPDHENGKIFNVIREAWNRQNALTKATQMGDMNRSRDIQMEGGPAIERGRRLDKRNRKNTNLKTFTNFHQQ